MTEIDRINLNEVILNNPHCVIVFDGGLLDGEEKEPFGFVPNESIDTTLYFSYRK